MRVKVCGIRNEQDLQIALKSDVDALGFLVGLTHFSEDRLEPEEAHALIRKIPPFTPSVLVTHLTDPHEVVDLAAFLGVSVIQIHSDMSVEGVREVRAKLPEGKLIKAIHVTPGADRNAVVADGRQFLPFVDALLLDSRTVDRLGGTGQTHDWSVSSAVVREIEKPVILAGGLNPANVRTAIEFVKPYAADVNSGVEDHDGNKSLDACLSFVQQAKGY